MKEKILLADDNETNRYFLVKVLSGADYEVVATRDGRELLEEFGKIVPDLVILDVHMPHMNGFATIAEIQKRKGSQHLPIIFISATYKDLVTKVKALDLGGNDYLTHPVEADELLAKVGSLLRVKKLYDEVSHTNEQLRKEVTERKRIEKEIEETKTFLEKVIESSLDGILITDVKGNILSANAAMAKMSGLNKQELLGKHASIMTANDKEIRKIVSEKIAELFEKGFTSYESLQTTQNGEIIEMECLSSMVKDAMGNYSAAVSIIRDITERKRAEEKIKQAKDNYETLINNIPVGVYSTLTDETKSRVTFISDKCQEWTGYSPEDFYKEPQLWLKTIHPEDKNKVTRASVEEFKSKTDYVTEYRVVHKDTGEVRYLSDHGVPIRDKEGKVTGYDGIVTDITESKRVKQVRRQKALLESINKVFRETLRAESEEAVAHTCLRVAEDLTGSKFGFIGEMNSLGFFDIIASSSPGWDLSEMKESKSQQLTNHIENSSLWNRIIKDETTLVINHPDRTERPEWHLPMTSFLAVPLKQADTTIGVIALANKESGYDLADQQDIEALSVAFVEALNRRRAETKVQQLNKELEENLKELNSINKELGSFSYSVSHDLRAPLRAIDGFSSIVLEEYSSHLDAEGQRYLNLIRTNIKSMGNLIDDLLNFTRLSRKELNVSDIDMTGLVKAIFSDLKPAAHERNLQLKITSLPPVRGDRPMIKQAISNLLSNAIKYTRSREMATIEIGCKGEADEHIYYIKDNGVGFDMRYVGKLFGMFQRLHSSEEYEGTGVGLTIIKRIIERHGGRIWAEGKVNQGATFYFTLQGKG